MTSTATSRLRLISPDFGRGLEGFRHRVPAGLQSTGISELDTLLRGGFPRGSLTEICGASSSGRTSVSFSLLAQSTARREACAFVDVSDSLDPLSLGAAGVDLTRILWIRCSGLDANHRSEKISPPQMEKSASRPVAQEKMKRVTAGWTHPPDQIRGIENAIPFVIGNENRTKEFSLKVEPTMLDALKHVSKRMESTVVVRPQNEHSFLKRSNGKSKPWKRLEQALKVTDLLLHAGGWGVVVFDLGNISWVDARRIELSTWFRFRRAIEGTPTILLLLGEDSCAKSCSSVVLRCERKTENWSSASAQDCPAELPTFQGFEMEGQIVSSRIGLSPMNSAKWVTKNLWTTNF